MTRQTSIDAYNTIKENGMLAKRRWEVYSILFSHGPMTGNQIIQYVGKIQNTGSIKTRLSELRDRGVVVELGTVKDPITGVTVILWDVTKNLPIKLDKPRRTKCPHCGGKGYTQEQQTRFL